MSATREQVIEFLSKMSTPELMKFNKEWQEAFGVVVPSRNELLHEAWLRSVPAYGAPYIPTKYTELRLTNIGDNALPVYGRLRELKPISLQEVKEIKDKLPYPVARATNARELQHLERELMSLGASIDYHEFEE
jgi:large subunit ribosomal protein L7/L12